MLYRWVLEVMESLLGRLWLKTIEEAPGVLLMKAARGMVGVAVLPLGVEQGNGIRLTQGVRSSSSISLRTDFIVVRLVAGFLVGLVSGFTRLGGQ